MKLTKNQIIILSAISLLTFFIVFVPHLLNPYPIHIDEYHHITEAIKLKQGDYRFEGHKTFELGFHVLLAALSYLFDLVLMYRFFAPIWTVLSALVIFYVIYKKTNIFPLAIFAMIFFVSIKSNVNITGLWFFTPLTFSIPFIFLYIFYYTEGIEKQNKKYILTSAIIIILLTFIHPISVLFAAPILLIYPAFHYKYIIKEYKFFSIFLIATLIGLIFFSLVLGVALTKLIPRLLLELQFKYGWGVLELENSPLELYSLIGYALAIFGLFSLFLFNKAKKYKIYIIWPITVLIYIIIFRFTGTSYLAPYQRNLYYLAISLPILSAFGLHYLLNITSLSLPKIKLLKKILAITIIILVIFFTFYSYFKLPRQTALYRLIDDKDYEDLVFLKEQEKGKVLAEPFISTALFPVSGHKPVATLRFYNPENRKETESFFRLTNCNERQKTINKFKADYIISKTPINCNYTLISDKNNYIYQL
jgi:hypothetical protein